MAAVLTSTVVVVGPAAAATTEVTAVPTDAAISAAAAIPTAGAWIVVPPHGLWDVIELSSDGPTELSLEATGAGGIPATGVAAVALTLTVVGNDSAGTLTVWGFGTPRPAVPSLTFGAAARVSSLVWVAVPSSGRISVASSGAGSVRFTLDTVGFTSIAPKPAAGSWVSLPPTRVLDTATGQPDAALVPAQRALTPRLAGVAGLPVTGVAAVTMIVTVRNPSRSGFLTVRPKGEVSRGATPGGSSLNFNAGQSAVSNLVIVPLGRGGRVQFFNNSYGEFDLSIDVTGYITAGAPVPGGLVLQKMARLMDTRDGTGPAPGRPAGVMAAESVDTTQVLGSAGLPDAAVAAVLLSVTVNRPTTEGSVGVSQTGRRPDDGYGHRWATPASVSYAVGQNVTNLVMVPLGSDGRIDVTNNSAGTLSLIVDVVGYVAGVQPQRTLRWSDPAVTVPSLADPVLLDCPTVTFCMAVNKAGEYSIFDGKKWRAAGDVGLGVSTPDYSPGAVTELSCPTETFCAAANSEWVAVFRNSRWEPAIRPRLLLGVIMGLSCVSADFCFAFENHGSAWTWNGSAWSDRSRMAWDADGPGYPVEYDVSCAPPTFCVAVGSDGTALASADPKALFEGFYSAPSESTGIDVTCLSPSFCATLHTPSTTTTFDGTSWTAWDQTWDTPMTSLSCGDPGFCVTVGSGNRISVWNGAGWTDPAEPITLNGSPILVSCPTGSFCMSLDQQGRQIVGRR